MSRNYFGTDGIRGVVGEGCITPQFFLHLGWAVGKAFAAESTDSTRNALVLIGKDTRISGYMFESALQAGLINSGVDVGLLGPMPTPAIAYLTRTFQANAGIVISASHNAYTDNGIKLFNGDGTKLPDALEERIEGYLNHAVVTAEKLGKARRIEDAEGRYIEFCKGSLPWGFNLSGMDIVLDCANGATYHLAPKVFSELGANVSTIGVEPDGLNINRGCGSTKLGALQEAVRERGADIGIAFDGDGDRVMFVDDSGEVLDGDEALFIIAVYRHKHEGACSGVAGTLMTNFGVELSFKDMGIPFGRAKVGDRYVIELMKKNGWSLGGESSGHIVCNDLTTTGDGVIAALQVLRAMQAEKQSLREIRRAIKKFPQVMINVPILRGVDVSSLSEVNEAVANAETQLNGSGRVLLRPSGTEPVIRVMIEGESLELVQRLTEELAAIVGAAATGPSRVSPG